ncbi:tetratricopeptide repeat protein [Aureivirga sp. CE67]|uniref:tetratricopeptide repeat protein n=1 Tax=Aureivirga sp. CE67 TaxID=1788983 RepID=UPI0018C93264|nr:tetratricopeptide repeat protein [Aureivirga sp. CE67]
MRRFLLIPILFILFSFATPKEACKKLITDGLEEFYKKNYTKSIQLLTKAKEEAQENDWNYLEFLAINNIGNNYYSMLDNGEALENYLEAYTIAIKELDEKEEMIVLNNISVLYSMDEKYEKAEEYISKAYEIALKTKEDYTIGLYSINLGEINIQKENREKAQEYFSDAIQLLEKHPKQQKIAKIAFARNLIHFKNYKEAEVLLNEISPKTERLAEKDDFKILFLLGETYFHQNRNSDALKSVLKSLENNNYSDLKVDIYQLLSDIYFKDKQYQKSLDTKNKAHDFYIETSNKTKAQVFEKNKIKFELEDSVNKLRENEIKMESQKKVYFITILFAIIVLAFLIYTIRNIKIKNTQRKTLFERNQKILELELKKKESDNLILEKQIEENKTKALLEKERLKNLIETRNRELSAKALYMSNRNELLTEIIKDLETNKTQKGENSNFEQIKKLKSLIQTDNEWNNFIKHFEEVNQGLLSRLKKKFSALNANDIRFISYVFMNLTSKEIASIFNITPDACRKRKERISKKLNLENSGDLFDFLTNF